MDETLGRITGLGGSRIMVTGQNDTNPETAARVGSMVVVRGKESDVVGVIDSMELDATTFQRRVAVTPLGEIIGSHGNGATFHRGVSHAPALGAFVVPATSDDLKSVYVRPSTSNVRIGTLSHDESQPAFVMVEIDEVEALPAAAGRGEERHPPAVRQHAQRGLEGRAADRVQHHLGAAAAGLFANQLHALFHR